MKVANDSKEYARMVTEKLKQEQEKSQQIIKEHEQNLKTQIEALQIENKMLHSEVPDKTNLGREAKNSLLI